MFNELHCGNVTEIPSGRRWTPSQMQSEVNARLVRYLDCGLQPGERVLIHFGNRLEFFAELLAIWKAGGCAIPVDSRLTAFEVVTATYRQPKGTDVCDIKRLTLQSDRVTIQARGFPDLCYRRDCISRDAAWVKGVNLLFCAASTTWSQ